MPYLFVENFESGLDTRKTRFTAPPGSLRVLKNAHINRGKEIERRKAFPVIATLPSDTKGLHSVQDQLITFGSVTTPAGMPALVQYQQLTSPNGGNLDRIYSRENFSGKVYLVAGFDDGSVHHYYDGVLVNDWETLAASNGSTRTIAEALAQRLEEDGTVDVSVVTNKIILTSAVPGTAFAVSVTANMTATETQAAVAAQPATGASASFEITGGSEGQNFNTIEAVEVDGVDILGSSEDFSVDVATTAANVAAKITAGTSGYSATSAGGVVTINALAALGASANGRVLTVTPGGDVTVASVNNFAGGTDAVPAVPEITEITVDSYAAAGTYTVTLDGTDYMIRGDASAVALYVKVVKQKIYAVAGSLYYFSGFADGEPDPTRWINGGSSPTITGAGFVDTSTQVSQSEILTGIGLYQDKLAVLSKRTIQIWSVDPDPAQNIIYQVLLNVGAIAAASISEYGDVDVFFLSDSGMRSLRARDSSNLASANDVGVSIDAELTEYMRTISAQQLRQAKAVVEPVDSRYLLAIGTNVYVFSNFPGSRIAAWSTYDLGGTVEDWAIADGKLNARVGDSVYRYGGFSGDEYDASETEVVLPFLDASNPALEKELTGIDAGLVGTWKIEMATEPDNPDEWETIASISEGTYGSVRRIAAVGRSTHFALRFTTNDPNAAIIGNAIIHYNELQAD